MRKNRIILVVASVIIVWLIFLLPKAVVENESQMKATDSSATKKNAAMPQGHSEVAPELASSIKATRLAFQNSSDKKNAIFADSLQNLYAKAGQFDSAAWFAEKAATFFNTPESFLKTGNRFYEAYTFAMDAQKQNRMAEKAREYLGMAVEANPKNLEAKAKMGLTYFSSNPPRGVAILREVIAEDPKNEFALFNMGMLSVQSGQNKKAIDWLKQLIEVNPKHIQGQMLLGVAYLNDGQKKEARVQFEKVKKMDNDPAVQSTVDSYLKDLK